jgi:hypothetical protein
MRSPVVLTYAEASKLMLFVRLAGSVQRYLTKGLKPKSANARRTRGPRPREGARIRATVALSRGGCSRVKVWLSSRRALRTRALTRRIAMGNQLQLKQTRRMVTMTGRAANEGMSPADVQMS